MVHNLRRSPDETQNWPPYAEGRESLKKEADYSRLVGGSFNKQGILHMRLVLGGPKTSRYLQLPTRILKVYIEALTGFSRVCCPDGLSNILLSQGCVLEMTPSVGTVGRTHIPRAEEGVRSLRLLVQLMGQPVVHIRLMTSSHDTSSIVMGEKVEKKRAISGRLMGMVVQSWVIF